METTKTGLYELSLTREIDAPRALCFRTWTDPTLLTEWWGPNGMTTPECEMELRAGGRFRTLMRTPDGQEFPTDGVFLEVVLNDRIVFTDAFLTGWRPSAKPFMVAITRFEDAGPGRTLMTASARHWTAEDQKAHEQMGFHQGWGESSDRFAALVMRRQATLG